jgi:CTP:molybdopterin cytidylyltransferase MocA
MIIIALLHLPLKNEGGVYPKDPAAVEEWRLSHGSASFSFAPEIAALRSGCFQVPFVLSGKSVQSVDPMSPVDALLAAGGQSRPGDPLYPLTQGRPKSLLDIAGKPMAQWVLDALAGSDRIGRVVIVGLGAEHGLTCGDKPVDYLPSAGNMVDNTRAGIERIVQLNPDAKYTLWASADIPTVRAEHVNWLVDTFQRNGGDAGYAVVERSVMEARFPASRRTYTHLKNLVVCGGDMNMLGTRLVKGDLALWRKITDARKSVFRQASLIGFETLFLLAVRQLTLERGVELVCKRLGIRGRAVICPFAEVGMDVDKPFQYDIVVNDLRARAGPAPRPAA